MLVALVLIVLVFALMGLPQVATWHSYGYAPSSVGVLLVVVLVVLLLAGRL